MGPRSYRGSRRIPQTPNTDTQPEAAPVYAGNCPVVREGVDRDARDDGSNGSDGCSIPKVDDRVQIWWTDEKLWYNAVVTEEGDGSLCAVHYDADGENHWHDFSETVWRPNTVRSHFDVRNMRYAAE